jgi:TonB-dependent starch-binding outer membrane protein SusC
MKPIHSWLFSAFALAVLGIGTSPASLSAQEGTITGQVVDAGTRQPLGQTQINVAALRIGALSEGSGRFSIQNVPPGTHVVRAQRLGFRTVEQTVTVAAGQAVVVNFELAPQALALDEVVVTGTAGQARRREVGNQITQLNVTEMNEPVRDVGALLQGRVAGATIREGSGNSGSAVDIRLRGNVSVSMSNQPLIYIDGVRVRSEAYPVNTSGDGRGIGASSDPPGPLASLNPDDIERIEVVKGPAATTLYGTEAAAGVIQIFTRRGSQGGSTWTAEVQQGIAYLRAFAPDPAPKLWLDPVLRNGHRQRYSVSTRGGTGGVNYFVSGSWQDNDGTVIIDSDKQWQARANLQWQATDALRFDVNNSFSESTLTHARYGNTTNGIVMNAARGDQGYNPMGRSPETMRALLAGIDDSQGITRFVGGVTVAYQPRPNFSQRFTVGYDRAQIEGRAYTPYDWRSEIGVTGVLGSINVNSFKNAILSTDYVGSVNFSISESIRSSFAWGFQVVEETEQMQWANGNQFPGPGNYTVRSAAIRTGLQDARRVITGGFFFEDRIDFLDRYFLTLGMRVDGNSAFGEALGLSPYPKASLSYVISDESFWPENRIIGDTKIRAAYGFAGRAPGAFDAVRTWNPIGWGPSIPAFQPGNLGNSELGPEITSEFEIGADASLFEGRVTADLTYYAQTTRDALFRVGTPASNGGWASQLENVGEIKNVGWEVELNADVVRNRNLSWNLGFGVATNKSEVVSLGGSAPFSVGGGGWVVEGQPAPVIRAWTIENFWEVADPDITRDKYVGPAFPTTMLNLSTSFTFPGQIVLSGRAEYQGGGYISNSLLNSVLSRSIPSPVCFDAYSRVAPTWTLGEPGSENSIPANAPREGLYAWERAYCFGLANGTLTTSKSDLLELRDITLALPLHTLVPQITGWSDRMDLRISARNLWNKTAKELMLGHPEQNASTMTSLQTSGHSLVKSINEQLPPMSYFTVSIRTIF